MYVIKLKERTCSVAKRFRTIIPNALQGNIQMLVEKSQLSFGL